VWPPTDDELDAWEVVPLSHGSLERTPAPPAVASPAAQPAPVSAAVAVAHGAVVVRTAPRTLTHPGEEPGVPSAPRLRAGLHALAERLQRHPAVPRSVMACGAIVLLVALLSAAAGFAAALWVGPTFLSGTGGEPLPTVLIVESREPGSQVLVNGEPGGRTPLRLPMTGGETRIEVEPGQPAPAAPAATKGRVAPTAGAVRGSREGGAAGSMLIRSTPPGARVVIGGRFRGVTPLGVGGIPAGPHDVEIAGTSGSVLRRVNVGADQLLTLDVDLRTAAETRTETAAPIQGPSGRLRVRSPIPLQILREGRLLGTSTAAWIPLEAGDHTLEVVGEEFEFATYRQVQMRPQGIVTLTVDVPAGHADFDAEPRAEVWVQGRRLGETPLASVELPLGVHEVVFRHPQLGERRETVTVRARTPARVSVRFTP
jgi:hypothetical protein